MAEHRYDAGAVPVLLREWGLLVPAAELGLGPQLVELGLLRAGLGGPLGRFAHLERLGLDLVARTPEYVTGVPGAAPDHTGPALLGGDVTAHLADLLIVREELRDPGVEAGATLVAHGDQDAKDGLSVIVFCMERLELAPLLDAVDHLERRVDAVDEVLELGAEPLAALHAGRQFDALLRHRGVLVVDFLQADLLEPLLRLRDGRVDAEQLVDGEAPQRRQVERAVGIEVAGVVPGQGLLQLLQEVLVEDDVLEVEEQLGPAVLLGVGEQLAQLHDLPVGGTPRLVDGVAWAEDLGVEVARGVAELPQHLHHRLLVAGHREVRDGLCREAVGRDEESVGLELRGQQLHRDDVVDLDAADGHAVDLLELLGRDRAVVRRGVCLGDTGPPVHLAKLGQRCGLLGVACGLRCGCGFLLGDACLRRFSLRFLTCRLLVTCRQRGSIFLCLRLHGRGIFRRLGRLGLDGLDCQSSCCRLRLSGLGSSDPHLESLGFPPGARRRPLVGNGLDHGRERIREQSARLELFDAGDLEHLELGRHRVEQPLCGFFLGGDLGLLGLVQLHHLRLGGVGGQLVTEGCENSLVLIRQLHRRHLLDVLLRLGGGGRIRLVGQRESHNRHLFFY